MRARNSALRVTAVFLESFCLLRFSEQHEADKSGNPNVATDWKILIHRLIIGLKMDQPLAYNVRIQVRGITAIVH